MEKDNEAGKPSLTNDHRSHLPDKAPVVTETESLVPDDCLHGETKAKKFFVPVELRLWFLLTFCCFTIVIFILLQLAASSIELRSYSFGNRDETSAPSSTNISTTSTPTLTPGAPAPDSFTAFGTWGQGFYFIGSYLPTIVAVLYGLVWQTIFVRLKEMEPFYQLASRRGNYGAYSLYLKYSDSGLLTTGFLALRKGHWFLLIAAVNVGLVTLCTSLASEVLYIRTTGVCGPTGNGSDCTPQLAVRAPLAWTISVVVVAILVIAFVLALRLRRRKSGIFAEATSIAGVASLLCDSSHPRIFAAAQDDPYPFERYMLGYQGNTLDGSRSYGLIGETPPQTTATYPRDVPVSLEHTKPLLARLPALATFWLGLVGVLVVVIFYRYISKTGTGSGFETFMDSESFGVRFLFTVIGLAIRITMSNIDDYNRKVTPYLALTKEGGAAAADSILIPTQSHALVTLFSTRILKDPLCAMISLGAVLSEVLIVTLSGVPFDTSESYTAFSVSVIMSVIIIGFILMLLPVVAIRLHGTAERIPAPSTCPPDVLRLLTDAETSHRFLKFGEQDTKSRNKALQGLNIKFLLSKGASGAWTLRSKNRG